MADRSGKRSTRPGQNAVQRSYASQLNEHEPLFSTYEHLQGLPRGDAALTMLRKVASMVKPIMRKRGWRVQVLAEFLPPEQNLLGLNINKGYKICIRLRYHNNHDLFLPIEEVIDTMLHELSHIIWGPHDSNFHRLWDELRDEYEVLVRKGYTGEGFLSAGRRLGGGGSRVPPQSELRRLARASAEKRKAQGGLSSGSGQRLGGTPLHRNAGDIRQVIADQVMRRNTIDRGCASGRSDANQLSDQASSNTFKTKAEEDDANDRAIAQALYELMEEEEMGLLGKGASLNSGSASGSGSKQGTYDVDPSSTMTSFKPSEQLSEDEQMRWALQESLASGSDSIPGEALQPPPVPLSSKPAAKAGSSSQDDLIILDQEASAEATSKRRLSPDVTDSTLGEAQQWTCQICTCINPLQFLACDACGSERPVQGTTTRPKKQPNSTRSSSTFAIPRRSAAIDDIPLPPPKETLGWNCGRCGAFMEHKWWTCSACGLMKDSS